MVASGSSGSPSSDSASSFNPSHSPLDPAARAPPAAPPPSSPPSPAVPSSDRSTSLPNQRALTAINVRSIEVPMYAQLRPCSRRCRIRSSSALVHRLFSLPPLPPPSAELACSPAPLRGLAPAGRASTGGAPWSSQGISGSTRALHPLGFGAGPEGVRATGGGAGCSGTTAAEAAGSGAAVPIGASPAGAVGSSSDADAPPEASGAALHAPMEAGNGVAVVTGRLAGRPSCSSCFTRGCPGAASPSG
mmetsp:Transcript_28287/g.90167  ORF Transcript_28287/g.90167 Transcript_28287/m.90167 type:complete len:247 (+) Transcript_28287:1487-2227(+)